MDVIEITEGKTSFFVPRQNQEHSFPPGSAPIFYNPRMELNRDATILLLSIVRPSRYLDAMGATGVRGLRVAHECGIPVTINDRNADAYNLILQNTADSPHEIEVLREDVNVLLSSRRFDAVDIDPFGTPAYFVDSAARSASRFLFLTATDTAPLCGAHLRAGMRRYFTCPRNTEYHSEVGLRILLGFVTREVIKYDRGIEPMFCYAKEHFIRLHLKIRNGAAAADRSLGAIGYVLQCPSCPFRTESSGLIPSSGQCVLCGTDLQPIGPLWLGSVQDINLVGEMLSAADSMPLGTARELLGLLSRCRDELDTASFYNYHALAKRWGCSPPAIEKVIGHLKALGYRASRTHHSGTGLKTDAPVDIIREALTPA